MKSAVEIVKCTGAGNWAPVTPDVVMVQAITSNTPFDPFNNYVSDPSPRSCVFSLPLSTPLHETQYIGITVNENESMSI